MTGRRFFGSTIKNAAPVVDDPLHAFGFRYGLITGYAGPLFKIRRSSDNTTLDCFSISDATTFVGANDGFIEKFYNHGGVVNTNLIQTTLTSQPKLIKAGVLQTINSKPAILFDRTTDFLSTESGIFSKARSIHWVYETFQTSSFIILSRDGSFYSYVATDASTNTTVQSGYNISGFAKIIKNGIEISIPVNRNEVYDQMIGKNVWTDIDVGIELVTRIGYYNNTASFSFLGKMAEIKAYGDPSITTGGSFNLADQIAVNNSLKTYFGI